MHHLSDKQEIVSVSNIQTSYSLPPGVNRKNKQIQNAPCTLPHELTGLTSYPFKYEYGQIYCDFHFCAMLTLVEQDHVVQ